MPQADKDLLVYHLEDLGAHKGYGLFLQRLGEMLERALRDLENTGNDTDFRRIQGEVKALRGVERIRERLIEEARQENKKS
jgi:hypothetical protein